MDWIEQGREILIGYGPKVLAALIIPVKLALDAHGISIPFPQRDVHLYPGDGDPGRLEIR